MSVLKNYEYVKGDPYPHQVTVQHYLFGWKWSEKLFVAGPDGVWWYSFPSMHSVTFSDDFRDLLRQEQYASRPLTTEP